METLYNFLRAGNVFTCVLVPALLLLHFFFSPLVVLGQNDGLSLTIAPPIFQINLQPGEVWSSGIKVVNNNPYDTTIYAETVIFEPSGESGRPVFITPPPLSETSLSIESDTLAGWITVPQQGVVISREQSYTLPVSIHVPEDASPGGHYAAILIGNKAPQGSQDGNTLSVTSSIASLIFLSVAGDVTEKGRIRDFFTERSLYQGAQANFSLRFENQGNVHLLPQGNIVIYNMFGKERGLIPINREKDYGSVLPQSVRKFDFSWESDAGMWDIGRYRADATIMYGKDAKQTALSTTYFYIIPFVALLQVVGALLASVLFFGWAVRAYIRRALSLEAKVQSQHPVSFEKNNSKGASVPEMRVVEKKKPAMNIDTLIQPIRVGLTDLRSVTKKQPDKEIAEFEARLEVERERKVKQAVGVGAFVFEYRYFFLFIMTSVAVVFLVVLFVKDVTIAEREYNVEELRVNPS